MVQANRPPTKAWTGLDDIHIHPNDGALFNIAFFQKCKRSVLHYIKKIKMGQEPMQNTQKPHTQYIAASRENKAPVQKTSRALAT
jgi:hypothetical protein